MTLAGGSQSVGVLVEFGAKVNTLIVAGQWWRLITPMFLHIGFEHIVLNMITLYFVGIQLENILGRGRFLAVYLVSGIAGNLASFAFNPDALSAGASTALFGLFGIYLMMGESFSSNPYIRAMGKQFLLLVVLNIMFGFYGNVDLAGHIGGLVGGFLMGYCVGVPRVGSIPLPKRIVSTLALVFLCIMMFTLGFKN
ncbi:rhomboid family integral membrane protein [Liquorilactobacillus mali]|uniref:Rhomboid family integral membrane protein n=2 Tax=Liquorilactobacillus mali TaxID=1618 RepID=A0A0R2G1X0_9LACO|nr:rhomboid family integral membrane protein [Liquorilactobacillus mali]